VEVGSGIDVVSNAGGDDGEDRRAAFPADVLPSEEPIFPSLNESLFILPMLASRLWCTTGGTRGSAPRSASRTVSIDAEKMSPFSRRWSRRAR
jgi:hypothetical protein